MSGDHNAHQNDFKPDWDTVKAFDDRYNEDTELLRKCLDALEMYITMDTVEESHLLEVDIAPKAITALRAALAEPEPQLKQRDGGCTLCGHCAATGEPIKRAHGIK